MVCLTEAYSDFFGDNGYVIEADADYGYPIIAARRKVMLWSRHPWTGMDQNGPEGLPPGRFVSARTPTPFGDLLATGVCIPWSRAHVDSGRRDRAVWEDHLAYLSAIGGYVADRPRNHLIMGDFNQRVPRKFQPEAVFTALQRSILAGFDIATSGLIAPVDRQAIDHVCHSRDLGVETVTGLSNMRPDGGEISDHFGVSVPFMQK